MSLEDLKLTYMLACFALGLIILSPTLGMILRLPAGERFSELWILGSNHMAEDYPFNVKAYSPYNVTLGVANHMGSLEYYRIYVKFRNQTEPLPNSVNGTPSPLNPIFEYQLFLRDGEEWEKTIIFSFEGAPSESGSFTVSNIVFDGYVLNVNKTTLWDEVNKGFYFQLFFELWIYDAGVSDFLYHNRFVGFWLNMTSST